MPEVVAQLRSAGPAAEIGYARTAAWGSRWATSQIVANKVATIVAMLVVAQMLTPTELGMAHVVNTVVGFITIMPVLVMADVLISHQRHLTAVARAAWGVAAVVGLAFALVIALSSPVVAAHYDKYSFQALAFLLAVSGVRPIAEALMIFPWTRLRLALRFKHVAIVNGLTRFSATVLMVAWAVVEPGAAAIVVPQILMTVARAVWFGVIAGGPAPRASRQRRLERRPELLRRIRNRMRRDFVVASLAQYVHTVTSGLAFLVATQFVSPAEIGQLAFAMMLAPQLVGMFTVQVGTVLQPIFGRLKSEPARQVAGFRRAAALIGAIGVPVMLLQAALAEPGIILFFGEKWLPAVPMLIAISLGQATISLLPTTLSLLKAQGRFGTALVWQAVQAVVFLAIGIPAAERFGAVGVTAVDSAVWTVSLFVAAWMAMRAGGVTLWRAFACLALPWAPAIPIAVGAWFAWKALPFETTTSAAIAIGVIGPAALLVSLVAIRVTQPIAAAEMAPTVARVLRRLPLVGPSIADWFMAVRAPAIPESPRS
ncbi:MAG: hypothetical protein FJ253_08080 [Phycisphaerae bacterium]|nr:hypothetical protein [Phycisphaerae bacterium]